MGSFLTAMANLGSLFSKLELHNLTWICNISLCELKEHPVPTEIASNVEIFNASFSFLQKYLLIVNNRFKVLQLFLISYLAMSLGVTNLEKFTVWFSRSTKLFSVRYVCFLFHVICSIYLNNLHEFRYYVHILTIKQKKI